MNRPFTIIYEYENNIACPNCTTPTFQTQQSIKTFWVGSLEEARDKFNAIEYDVNVRICEVRDDWAIAKAMGLKEKQQKEKENKKSVDK